MEQCDGGKGAAVSQTCEAKECEACGQPGAYVVEQVGGYIERGTTLCNTCAHHRGAFAVSNDIRARRRSPQPESGPVDADGVTIKVGDEMQWGDGSWKCTVVGIDGDLFTGTITHCEINPDAVGKDYFPLTTGKGSHWVHSPPAQPEAKASGWEAERRNDMVDAIQYSYGTFANKLPTWAEKITLEGLKRTMAELNPRTVLASDALAEVERQVALVKRLDFDLRMLKLLGQGWSRGDPQTHLARSASLAESDSRKERR